MDDTRRQILLTIKEQVTLLGDHCDPVSHKGAQWSPQQWWESFTFLFVNHNTGGSQQHQDDLLFFVKLATAAGGSPQVFVRRKSKQLPGELQLTGRDFSSVDWAQTVLLNLVLHSQYQLTVVACGPEALPFVAQGRTWSQGMISVMRPVYASTTVTAVNLDSSRAKDSNPQPCYPDICFAVDNFDNAFEELVLEEASRCYCVVLHAMLDMQDTAAEAPGHLEAVLTVTNGFGSTATHVASQQQQQNSQVQHRTALRTPSQPGDNRSSVSTHQQQTAVQHEADAPVAAPARHSSTDESGSVAWQIGTHKRTLFAGYVSFQQIADFMEGNSRVSRNLLDSWLKGPKAAQKDKVVMTGPGGMGRCEVAVTRMEVLSARPAPASSHSSSSSSNLGAQQQQQQQQMPPAGQTSPAAGGQQRQGLLHRGLQRARFVASGVQQAFDVLAELQPAPAAFDMLCALMTLRLPVNYVAQELLASV